MLAEFAAVEAVVDHPPRRESIVCDIQRDLWLAAAFLNAMWLQIVDGETSRLAFRAPQLLSRLPSEGYSAELQRSTVETNTPVCDSLELLHRQVFDMRSNVIAAAVEQEQSRLLRRAEAVHENAEGEVGFGVFAIAGAEPARFFLF